MLFIQLPLVAVAISDLAQKRVKLQNPCCTQSTILASDLPVQATYGSSRRAEKVTG
jgi:hypothetical protein